MDTFAPRIRIGLDSFLTEIKKLKLIRAVGLPPDLFTGVSEKLLKTYRNRASTESPYDLRRHKDTIRYTPIENLDKVGQASLM